MIDAMCSECRHFGCRIFHPKPGWTCAKDEGTGREHDPTDQACAQFRRRREAVMLVAQDIPVPVHPTGKLEWNSEGEIVSVEVAPEAAHWGGFTTWIQPHKLIWANTPSDVVSRLPDMLVSREELIQVCGFEAAVAQVSAALLHSGERTGLSVLRAAAEGLVDATHDLGLPINPVSLVKSMVVAGRIGDLVSGVSARSIIIDLMDAGLLSKWGVAGFQEPGKDAP
jgi:hypothetical protein